MKCLQLCILLLLIHVIPFIFISCTDQAVSVIIKPSISITNPVMNSNVPDSTTINVEVININNIIRVELSIDHNIVSVFNKPPYSYFWYTFYYDDGSQHIIEAKAYDNKGNTYAPPPSIVYVYRFMPSWLTANLISGSMIVLNWNDNCNYETGYEIEQANGDSLFKKIASVDSNTTTFTVKGSFQKGQKYLFRVRAKAGNSFSGYSNIAYANIVLKAPDITNVVYTSDTTATISWNDSSDFESSFSIQQVKNGYLTTIKTVPANTTSTQITGEFINGIYYTFAVAAVDSFLMTTSPTKYFQYVFNPPTNLTITEVDMNKVQLTWTNSASLSTQIKIEKKESGSVYMEVGTVSAGVSTFTDINLDTSKTYYYRAKAFTRINNIYSNEIKVAYAPQIVDYNKIKAPSNIASYDISKDGSYIVIGGYTPTNIAVYLLDANNGNLIRTYYPHDSLHICDNIGISYDNSVIAGGGNANRVNLWNVNDGSFKGVFNLGNYAAGLIFHPSKNIAVTFTDALNNIGIWNYETCTQLYKIYTGERIYSLSMSKNGNQVAAAGENDVKIIDVSSGTVIKTLPGQSVAAIFCDDDKYVISGYLGKIKIWNIDNLTSTEYNFQYSQIVDVAAISGTNYVIFTDGGGFTVGFTVIDKSTGKIISRYNSTEGNAHMRLLPDNKTIVSYEWNYLHFRKLEKRWLVPYE